MGEAGDHFVPVPRRILTEILEDGTCPLHLRLQLRRVMRCHSEKAVAEVDCCSSITSRIKPCLPLIAAQLPLAEVLAVRACSPAGLDWVMQRGVAQLGGTSEAHDRIRTRLWIQRVADVNRESADETVYETPVRRLADDALRRRMEAEMADARHDMEQQIRAFQVEVDRRMEQQAVRVHAIVEERVQQQLDTILVAEMEKVRAMVEERVQGRVRAVVQREVRATVCEMQVQQAMLAHENERLRTALLEQLDHSDLCFRSLVWALSPNATGFFARTLRLMWSCRRRFTRLSAWLLGVPPDRRREGLRSRLEALQRAASDFESEEPSQGVELRSLLAPTAERELPELPQTVRRQLLMAIVAAAAALPGDARGPREPRALAEGDVGEEAEEAVEEAEEEADEEALTTSELPARPVVEALPAEAEARAPQPQPEQAARSQGEEEEEEEASPRLSEPPSEDDTPSPHGTDEDDAQDSEEAALLLDSTERNRAQEAALLPESTESSRGEESVEAAREPRSEEAVLPPESTEGSRGQEDEAPVLSPRGEDAALLPESAEGSGAQDAAAQAEPGLEDEPASSREVRQEEGVREEEERPREAAPAAAPAPAAAERRSWWRCGCERRAPQLV